jgi:EAL domain-containing protein (putative c-di-GMP-specific phosphodiesterase class I)
LIEAELAMYDAKAAGRDRAVVYDPAGDAPQRMQAQVTWVERIRRALEEERLVLLAQPILPLGTDATSRRDLLTPRHELLVRMLGDDGELVPPGAFLALAEQADLIQQIDRWVLERAIELLAEHQAAGRELCLEVNLSAKSVNSPLLPGTIAAALARTGADPRGLVLEVTETAAIVNLERAQRFAAELKELGCQFALDDFGTGFASFLYLKHLSFDYLKIDGEFIRGLADSHTNQLVVRSLVEIARGLDKRTIAECVEDDATRHLLERYGVDYVQGHLIGRPAPLEEMTRGRRGAAARTLRET